MDLFTALRPFGKDYELRPHCCDVAEQTWNVWTTPPRGWRELPCALPLQYEDVQYAKAKRSKKNHEFAKRKFTVCFADNVSSPKPFQSVQYWKNRKQYRTRLNGELEITTSHFWKNSKNTYGLTRALLSVPFKALRIVACPDFTHVSSTFPDSSAVASTTSTGTIIEATVLFWLL